MKIDNKKLKRKADIGDRLDLGLVIAIVISLFGIGIFYNLFRAGILQFIDVIGLAISAAVFVISGILYGIGKLNRRGAKKIVFNYIDETVRGVVNEICRGDEVNITLDLSIKKEAIIFTLSGGAVTAACDLTAAKRLPAASILFIIVCLGVVGGKVKSGAEGGRAYKNVAYTVVVNGSPSPSQYFVCGGKPNAVELDAAIKRYNTNRKKYKK